MSNTGNDKSSELYEEPVLSRREQGSYHQRERDRRLMEVYKRLTLRKLRRSEKK